MTDQQAPPFTGAPTKTALLIIDVQQGLFARPTPVYQADQLLGNITLLIDKARRAGVAVIYCQHANKGTLKRGSAAWQLHDALQPLTTETVFHKTYGNAFEETNLQATLAAKGITTLIVTGLVTHGCVKATCLGAVAEGYGVVLVADGHSSYNKNAADLIAAWNEKLGKQGIELRRADQIEFAAY